MEIHHIAVIAFILIFIIVMSYNIKKYITRNSLDGYLTSVICLIGIGLAVGGLYLIYIEGF